MPTIQPTDRAPHVEHLIFCDFPSFQAHIQRTLSQWAGQVQQGLRLIALNGILDPVSRTPVPASALTLNGTNYRETLSYRGCLARHRPGATPGLATEAELLMEPEFHGDPIHPEQGSFVYQIPAWDLLEQARAAGLSDPAIHWIAAPSYGVLGQELPAVMVLVAQRR